MKYFNKDAVLTYLSITKISYDYYLVSDIQYVERLYILKQLCLPRNKDCISNIDFYLMEFFNWNDIVPTDFFYYDVKNLVNNESLEDNDNQTSLLQSNENNINSFLFLITNISGKISKWIFHKSDCDFFPSIPHGHAVINNGVKLDPFTGYIYKKDHRFDRENRQFIVNLWNDEKFRIMARECIEYYLKTYPNYKGWRVNNPLKLPRKR